MGKNRGDWTLVEEGCNHLFTAYYKANNIVPNSDWETLIKCLNAPLPINFRFTGSKTTSKQLENQMINDYFKLLPSSVDGVEIQLPSRLPWYPQGLGWQYNATRSVVRNNQELTRFHGFLVQECEAGNISRQGLFLYNLEAVSMIPPLLLDVESHHTVLDMCAAPGSKTAQIIEMLHANSDYPTGLVIANDSNYDSSCLLVRQIRRLCSPNSMVTNHDAQNFPFIYRDIDGLSTPLLFDRILADVPCSGDGTLRKNKAIWKTWSPSQANHLFKVQTLVFQRGVELLKIGGTIVYSTCSLNPVENEAVVANILNICGGSLELIDVSEKLQGLVRSPGISTWKIMGGKDAQLFDRFEDVPMCKENRSICKELFPPENASTLGLEKCLRILPHAQDTGGFFVAVFRKVASFGSIDSKLPVKKSEVVPNLLDSLEASVPNPKRIKIDGNTQEIEPTQEIGEEDTQDISVEPTQEIAVEQKPKKTKRQEHQKEWTRKESDFIFLDGACKDVEDITQFYGIKDTLSRDNYIVRSDKEKKQNIYYCSTSIKQIIQARNAYKLHVL